MRSASCTDAPRVWWFTEEIYLNPGGEYALPSRVRGPAKSAGSLSSSSQQGIAQCGVMQEGGGLKDLPVMTIA